VADELGVSDVFDLLTTSPASFTAISSAAAGIYLTEDVVKREFGYPGPTPLDTGDPTGRVASYEELTRPVVARGFTWRRP
jgi:hypothetical protein